MLTCRSPRPACGRQSRAARCGPTWRSRDWRGYRIMDGCGSSFRRMPMSELDGQLPDVSALLKALDDIGYLADEALGTALFLAARMGQPILLEGEPGVGKTEAAKALATVLDTPLIRLQCYEGLTSAEALYE